MTISKKTFRFLAFAAAILVAANLFTSTSYSAQSKEPGKGNKLKDRSSQTHHDNVKVLVGAASRSILPLVNGSLEYFNKDKLPSPKDPVSPGIFVKNFDAGRIAVGNGASEAHWVHDDLRVRAMALENPGNHKIVVLLSADVYMIFGQDADEIRKKAKAMLPPGLAKRLTVLVGATHTHHGPDTAFDVNHQWYEHMTEQAAKAVSEAVMSRRPAVLKVGQGKHWFGIRDSRDPQIIDPTMNVLQAKAMNGDVIATVVQWNLHPEATLFWDPPADIPEDCAKLGWSVEKCSAQDRYFSSDFVGWMTKAIQSRVGGEVLYFQGALGGLMTSLGAPVWEVTEEIGLGNQYDPPAGAVPAGGSDFSFTDKNFRRAVVIGRQAAYTALNIIEEGEPITRPTISYEQEAFYTRLTNMGFRSILVVDSKTGRPSLGHNPRMLYTCPAKGLKNDETCRPDHFKTSQDPLVGTIRQGNHIKSEVGYLKIGPIGMMFVPGEITGELVRGLPNGFKENPEKWFSGSLDLHAAGADYTIPGYITNRMDDRYKWVVSLGNDELGYVVPLSDWRIRCVGDALGKPGTCKELYQSDFIPYPDSLSGQLCKAIAENPNALANVPVNVANVLKASCRYGQVLGEAESHYEETNSVGWDLASDILETVAKLTGNDDDDMVNEDFHGYWERNPPPVQ